MSGLSHAGVQPALAAALPTASASPQEASPRPTSVAAAYPPPSTIPPNIAIALPQANSPPVPVQMTYVLRDATRAATQHAARRLQYVSTSNTLIRITVTPLGGTGTLFGPTACTPAACAINFTANPGPNTIAFSLVDGGGNVLSNYSTTTIVQTGTLNTLSFTANPVVNSVTLTLASSTVNAGTAVNDVLTVAAKDADGSTIVENAPYVDANGAPVVVMLNVTPTQSGGLGTISLQGATRMTTPSTPAIFVRYDGNWIDHAVISASTNSASITTPTPVTLTTNPCVTEYSTGITTGAHPRGVAAGADGNVWFTEQAGNRIGRITPKGAVTEFSVGSSPVEMIDGPDGNIWFSESTGNAVGFATLNGSTTSFTVGIGAGVNPDGIAVGPDGNIWVAEYGTDKIGKFVL